MSPFFSQYLGRYFHVVSRLRSNNEAVSLRRLGNLLSLRHSEYRVYILALGSLWVIVLLPHECHPISLQTEEVQIHYPHPLRQKTLRENHRDIHTCLQCRIGSFLQNRNHH